MQSYRYDAAGRLAEVVTGAGVHTYGYGASNQRLQMIEAGALGGNTLYTWEGGSFIAEYNGASNGMAWTKSYIYLGGRLLATEAPLTTSTTEIKYQHPDRLGTRLVTSSTGAVVSENISLPFGATISGESLNLAGSATKKRFTSYDRSDTTKLDYAMNRHYSSAQGRFTQVDPIGMSATQLEDPQSLNLYAYCGNDPINQIDPSGLFSWKNVLGIVSKVVMWVGIAVLVGMTILSHGATGSLAYSWYIYIKTIWAVHHGVLAALLGIHKAQFVFSLASVAVKSAVILQGVTVAVGAVSLSFGPKGAGGGGAKGSGGGKGNAKPTNNQRNPNPPQSRLEGWARIWRDILYGNNVAPRSGDVQWTQTLLSVYQLSLTSVLRKHHIFPQWSKLQPFFTNAGVNVHEATVIIPLRLHTQLHGGGPNGGYWNQSWDLFFRQNPLASREQIFLHANSLMRDANLYSYPIVMYGK